MKNVVQKILGEMQPNKNDCSSNSKKKLFQTVEFMLRDWSSMRSITWNIGCEPSDSPLPLRLPLSMRVQKGLSSNQSSLERINKQPMMHP